MSDPETSPDADSDALFAAMVGAFALAPLAAALALVLPGAVLAPAHGRPIGPDELVGVTGFFCVFTYPSGLLVGLPLWALLRSRIAHSWFLCAAAGTLTAWLTLVFLSLVLWPLFLLLPSNLALTSTLFGYMGYAGAVGGFTVWLIAGSRRTAPAQ